MSDRRFWAFAALHCVDLLAYNQLYLAFPVELRRVAAGPLALGLVFIAQTVVIFGSMAFAAGHIGRLLARRPRLGPWLDRLCGVLFIGLAVRLMRSEG